MTEESAGTRPCRGSGCPRVFSFIPQEWGSRGLKRHFWYNCAVAGDVREARNYNGVSMRRAHSRKAIKQRDKKPGSMLILMRYQAEA